MPASSRLVRDELEALEILLLDCFSAGFGPLNEPLNLSLRPAAACVRTCSSDGLGRFANASQVAMTWGATLRRAPWPAASAISRAMPAG